jgi:ParB family chromosome partitioning protein
MASEPTIFNIPTPGILTEILISRIHHSNFLLRDTNIAIGEIKESISQQGLLHPIIVRIIDDQYEVVAGNRRFAACKHLGWKRIMCHVLELDEKDAFEVSLIENLQHKTLNPIEEAYAYKRYTEEHGWGSISQLARRIGKSHSYVSNRIRLLNLSQDIIKKIVCRQTNASVVLELLSIEDKDQRHILADETIYNNLTRQEVRNLLHNDVSESFDSVSNTIRYSQNEILLHEKEKAFFRFITALKIALMRLDDTLEAMDQDDWVLWHNLMHYRIEVHREIDDLIILRKKTRINFDRMKTF